MKRKIADKRLANKCTNTSATQRS